MKTSSPEPVDAAVTAVPAPRPAADDATAGADAAEPMVWPPLPGSPAPTTTDGVPRPLFPAAEDDAPTVTPVRFDRPVAGGYGGAGWGDPALERRASRAALRGYEQGRAAGYAAGWAQGRRAAAEQERAETAEREREFELLRRGAAADLERVLGTLRQGMRDLDATLAPTWAEVGDAIADGALAIARAALGRELAASDAPTVEAVRTALHLLAEPSEAVVRVNPADLADVQALADSLGVTLPPGLRLVPDAEIEAGTLRAATPTQRLLLSLPQAVAAAEEVLRP